MISERWEDRHNLVVSAMVTRTEVLQCKQYLHLVHNSALNSSDKFEKVRPFFNATNELCILNYQPTQHVNVDDSIVPYFGKYGARLYISVKPIKFRFELWVMATPLGYCLQFRPYVGKDSILQKYENIGLGIGASVVPNLVRKIPLMQTTNYHIFMYNYFTSPALLRHLNAMGVPATGAVKANWIENVPLRDMVKMNKGKRGSSDAVTGVSSNINAVC